MELVAGEPIPLASASPQHNIIRGTIEHFTRGYFKNNPLGGCVSETDCRLDDTVRKPDPCVFTGDDWNQLDRTRAPIPFAPTMPWKYCRPPSTSWI